MTVCAVRGCHNSSDKNKKDTNITFHQFPTNPVMNERWAEKIRLNRGNNAWKPSKITKICSIHFDDSLKYNTDGGLTRLRRGAIPTRNLHILCLEHHPQPESLLRPVTKAKKLKGTDEVHKDVSFITSTADLSSSADDVDDEIEAVFDTPREASLRKQLKKKTWLQAKHNKKIKVLQQKIQRLIDKHPLLRQKTRQSTKINYSLQQILVNLRKERYINNDIFNVLKEHVSAAQHCNSLLKKSRKSKRVPIPIYTPEFKKFCVTLNFYSPLAYNYVLRAFNSCLPDPKIIYNWYRNNNGSPGLTEESLELLKLKVKSTEKKFVCALVADEMLMQPEKLKSCYGSVDFGTGPLKWTTNATEACIFTLVCLNEEWQIPLGYFLVHGLTGSQKKNLVNMCLTKCEEVGVKVTSVTFNANATNISAVQLLGCQTNDTQNMKTTFKHPTADHEVAIFFDPSNVVKLIREQFENTIELLDEDKKRVSWRFLAKLNELLESKLASKLIQDYIDAIRNVKQDDQVFSQNIALALKFCRESLCLDEFKDSEGTENFITIISDLFDMFHSKRLSEQDFCDPLSSANKYAILEYLDKCKQYILVLQIIDTGKPNYDSESFITQKEKYDDPKLVVKSSPGYKEMLVCVESLKHLFFTLVQGTRELDHISTYRLSQCHSLKMHGGQEIAYPNAEQFKDGYRNQLKTINVNFDTTSCAPSENGASDE